MISGYAEPAMARKAADHRNSPANQPAIIQKSASFWVRNLV
jgi:hypothetical protein